MRLTPRNSKNLVRGVTPPNPLHEQGFWSRLSPEQLSLLNLKVIVPTSGSLSWADEVLQKRVCLTQIKFREGQLPGHFCDLSCRLESNSIDERVTGRSYTDKAADLFV